MNHRHADFQSRAICSCSIASSENSVKPQLEDQTLSGGLSNLSDGDEARRSSVQCRVEMVREARKLFGLQAARRLWFGLGLPLPDGGRSTTVVAPEIEEFVSTVLIQDPLSEIAAADAYKAFVTWASANHKSPRTLTAFGRVMQSTGVARRRSNGTKYVGYRLPETPEPPLNARN